MLRCREWLLDENSGAQRIMAKQSVFFADDGSTGEDINS